MKTLNSNLNNDTALYTNLLIRILRFDLLKDFDCGHKRGYIYISLMNIHSFSFYLSVYQLLQPYGKSGLAPNGSKIIHIEISSEFSKRF